MKPPARRHAVRFVGAKFFARLAAAKGRRRQELAAMDPEAAQALVSSLPPGGGAWMIAAPAGGWHLGFPETEDPASDDGTGSAPPP